MKGPWSLAEELYFAKIVVESDEKNCYKIEKKLRR
jgi:hypothetical protein